ncbi:UAA transporter family-domain-containing protein [Trametes meyenii]|nr:UAA transporter family-domain-containing protein [Trametes meyenii]
MSASDVLGGLTLGIVSDWATTLGLIFGGCCRSVPPPFSLYSREQSPLELTRYDRLRACSNALTLEQLTRSHPHSGSLITFAQFVLISVHGLPKFLVFSPLSSSSPTLSSPPPPLQAPSSSSFTSRTTSPNAHAHARGRPRWWRRVPVPHLRPRRTPLAPYLAQVALFYGVSLLNNAAFAYAIPMPVHIIFRSGGLVISMLMGWLFAGKRYNATQVLSVLLVTAGVVLTTLAASAPKNKAQATPTDSSSNHGPADTDSSERWRYATGIALLTLALVLSGFLGIVQDWTYARYVRRAPSPAEDGKPHANGNGHSSGHLNRHAKEPEKPPVVVDAARTATEREGSGRADVEPWQESMFYLHFLSLPMFLFVRHDLAAQVRALDASPPLTLPLPLLKTAQRALTLYPPVGLAAPLRPPTPTFALPRAYALLALTAATALVCVAGVHRLSGRGVSALTVTLLLVVRKAASLVLSVVLFRAGGSGSGGSVNAGVWAGAGMVFAGTMGYAAGSRRTAGAAKGKEKEKKVTGTDT